MAPESEEDSKTDSSCKCCGRAPLCHCVELPQKGDTRDPLVGTIWINRFKIVQLISPTMEQSRYFAEDTNDHQPVIIVIYWNEIAAGKVENFHQYNLRLENLRHHNLVAQLDHGLYGQNAYIVNEHFKAGTLAQKLKLQTLSSSLCVEIFSKIMSGLAYFHDHGLVHGNLKPANVMISDSGRVKLRNPSPNLHFAISTSQEKRQYSNPLALSDYFSPEQAMGKKLTPESDIYALGITMYEALTGRLPFIGKNPVQVASQHLSDPPPKFSEIRPDLQISKELQDLVLRSLEKEPLNRYSSMKSFKEALENCKI